MGHPVYLQYMRTIILRFDGTFTTATAKECQLKSQNYKNFCDRVTKEITAARLSIEFCEDLDIGTRRTTLVRSFSNEKTLCCSVDIFVETSKFIDSKVFCYKKLKTNNCFKVTPYGISTKHGSTR